MKRLIISLLIVLSVSTTTAFIFWDRTPFGFIKYFLLALVGQFIVQYFLNQYLNAKYGTQVTQLELSLANELNRNIKPITCPCYLKHIQEVDLELNNENIYVCTKCDKHVSAVIEVSSAMATKPVSGIKAEISIPPQTTNE